MKYLSILMVILTLGFGFNSPVFAKTTKANKKVHAVKKAEKVNINTATAEELTQLKGIGPKKAKAIDK